tara:strand:+ start:6289 stop:6843 length:555 start_codon:yes stop_codon:yes gene_type:complete
MAEKITVNSRVHTKWNRSKADSNNINNAISDIGQIDLTASYVTGVGPFQTEELFHDVRNLTVNQIYTYDLSDLTGSLLDFNLDQSMGHIKGITIRNNSSSGLLEVSTTGSANGFGLFLTNSASGVQMLLPPSGLFSFVSNTESGLGNIDHVNNLDVTASSKHLSFKDVDGAAVTYELVIWGTED